MTRTRKRKPLVVGHVFGQEGFTGAIAKGTLQREDPYAKAAPELLQEALRVALRLWRDARGIETAKESYAMLERLTGVPRRTFEHVEAGRGFRYPKLLLLALTATAPRRTAPKPSPGRGAALT